MELTQNYQGDTRNPVTQPQPYVFTITGTSFAILFACESAQQLDLWMDKINLTVSALQGMNYQPPAIYRYEASPVTETKYE